MDEEERRQRKDQYTANHLTVMPGSGLVDRAVSRCISEIEAEFADYLDADMNATLVAYEGISEGRLRFHLYREVAKRLVVVSNADSFEAQLRGDDDVED